MGILALCIFANVLLGIFFKLFSRFNVDNHGAIVVNYITCVFLAFAILGESPIPADLTNVKWFPYALGLGFVFIFGFNLLALTFQKFSIAFTTIIQKMSLIISVGFTLIFYHEALTSIKIAGLALAFVAIVLVNYSKDMFNQPVQRFLQNKYLILPLSIFLLSGIIEVLLFYLNAEHIVEGGDIRFVATSFGVAGILGFLYILIPKKKTRHRITRKELLAGLILGIPNFLTIYLLVILLHHGWEGSVLFPLNNIGILLFSALAGFLIFRERLNVFNTIGLVCSIVSILLIALS